MYLYFYPDQSFLKDSNKYGCEFMRNVKTIFLKRATTALGMSFPSQSHCLLQIS